MSTLLATLLFASTLTSSTWLQNVRTDSFTVMCETKSCLERLRLEYWPEGGVPKSARFTYLPTVGGTFVAKAKVDIAGHAGETIRYQISEKGKVLGDAGSYGSVKLWGAADDGDFTAVVWGDNQNGMTVEDWSVDPFAAARGAFTHMMTRKPDFGLSTGDMSGGAKYAEQLRPLLLKLTNPILGHYIPYYVAWGNHDSKFASGWVTVRPFFATGYDGSRGDFALADNYTLVRGDVFFAFVDDYGCEANVDVLKDDGCVARYERERTREWLKKVLSSDEAQNAKFRIVLQHAPVYLETWGSHAVPAFKDLFNEYRVDLVLSGHMHGCERIAVPGDTFIQLTNGGLGYLDNDEEVEANYGEATFIGGHKDIPYLWARESAPGVLGTPEPVFMGCLPSYTELNAKGEELTVSFHGFNTDGSYIGAFDKFTLSSRRSRPTEGQLEISYPSVAYDTATSPAVAIVPGEPITKAAWYDFERNALHRDVAAPSLAERDRPATGMSRREAEAFAAWADGGTDRYRLPTVAELEGLDAGIAEWTGEDDPATGWCRIANCAVGHIATPCAYANYLGFRLVEQTKVGGLKGIGMIPLSTSTSSLHLSSNQTILIDDFFSLLAENLNGTSVPGDLANLLDVAKALLKGNADIAADALIKIAPVLDDGQLAAIFKSYGYSLWSGSGTNRKIDIQKKYTVSAYPTPNELADNLAKLLKAPLDNACKELDKAGDSSDTVLSDGVKNLIKMFGVDLGDLGDLHFDQADLLAFKAVLKTVQGAVSLLKGMDLENDYETFVKVLGDIDAEAFFVEVPALFKGVQNQTQLNNSREFLKLALTTVKDADALIQVRKDSYPHLIGIGEAGHLIAYGDDKVFEILRGNSAALIAALDGPSALNVKEIFAALGETPFAWLKRDTYRVSLLPIFKGKYTQAISPVVEADGTLWPETLPDPTFGGLLPDLTMSEALAFFENMQRDQLWSYAAYDTYQVNMPFEDGTSNGHGGRRTILAAVEGEDELVFSPAMAKASAASSLTLLIDGAIAGVWSNDAPESVAIPIAGAGLHDLEWIFAVEGNVLQPAAGVHPVADFTYGGRIDPEPKRDEGFRAGVAITNVSLAATFAEFKGWKAKGLPAGVKWDSKTGLLKGTPTKPGAFTVTFTLGKEKVQKPMAIANYVDAEIPIADAYGPYRVGVAVSNDLSKVAAGTSVSGLPSGLKWDKKTFTLKGVPKKAGTFTAVFTKKIKDPVTRKSVTHKASATIVVEALDLTAIGTFNGGGEGLATFTVSKTGKISGKYLADGKTWKLSAASFATYDAETATYAAELTAKCGKEIAAVELHLDDTCAQVRSQAAQFGFSAYRNGWKDAENKELAKALKGKTWSNEPVDGKVIVFTVGSSGAVKAKLTTTGLNAKPYTATCSTVLIPKTDMSGYIVFYYFPPKKDKFPGFAGATTVTF